VVETLRHKEKGNVYRADYYLVQTPQTFDIQLLKAANRQPYRETFTDDASVVEAFGFDITPVDGNRENIKITTPFDICIAEAILSTHHSPLTTHP
jgi:2-C-methyl-D-erythritol 4-phosphate cytidylyltransferase